MLKKIYNYIRFIIILLLWSYFSFTLARFVFLFFWKFDILMIAYWQYLQEFWNQGGVIRTTKDYAFAISTILLPFIWFFGLRKLVKFDFTKIISIPFSFFNNLSLSMYKKNTKRIIIKNLSDKNNLSFEDLVAQKIKEEEKKIKEKNNNLEADNIRENIAKKISKK